MSAPAHSSALPHKAQINFLRGWPNEQLLPTELLRQAAHTVLSDTSLSIPAMQYGPDEGDHRLRDQLAKWLSQFYQPHLQDPIQSERITITGGASQNLACTLQTFTDPEYTRNVWIVAPAYFLAFRIFEDSGFAHKLRAVAEDEQGINIDHLRREMCISERAAQFNSNLAPIYKAENPWSKTYKHVIYAVPTFSNPSSKTMTLQRRQELVRLAREYDALIITDDVYDQLQWFSEDSVPPHAVPPHAVLPRIVDVDRYLDGGPTREDADGFGNAASNGSFSKIVGPGVRTGWCEGSPKFAYGLSQTGSSRSGGCASQLTATFIAEALANGGLQKHIEQILQPAYAIRWRKMIAAVEKFLIPLGVTLPQTDREIAGGYFIWIRLPPHIRARHLSRRCKNTANLVIAEGGLFEVPEKNNVDEWEDLGDKTVDVDKNAAPTTFEYHVRLCFAYEDENLLEEGIKRLAGVIASMLKEPEGINPLVTRFDSTQGESDWSSDW